MGGEGGIDVLVPGMAAPRRIAPDWVAADLADRTGPAEAQVVSVHAAVVNLAVDAWPHLLMIAGPGLYRGPAAVGLSATGFAAVRTWLATGAAVRYAPDALTFTRPGGTTHVDLGGPAVSFAPPGVIDFRIDAYRDGLPAALAALRAATAGDLCSVLLSSDLGADPFAGSIVEAFPTLVRALDSGDGKGFVEAARRLVGLGYGSTPTGDDLIHGALVAVHYLDRCVPAQRMVARPSHEALRATTRLGAHMLVMGSLGLTPEPVRAFLVDLLGGRSVSAALRGVSQMGADSGRTIAVGAALTVATLLGDLQEGERTA
jgi:hypothetical protein